MKYKLNRTKTSNIPTITPTNKSLDNTNLESLVLSSQNGDSSSKELLIKKYYSFIVSKTKEIT
ncbi:MAG: hypothetical protein ACRC68_09655 [Clostridium sp.]